MKTDLRWLKGLRQKMHLVMFGLCVFFMILGISALASGFDKKDNYFNVEYSSLNKNAYVGGDAYNYIINGTYFSGYAALASGFIVSSTLCGTMGVYCLLKEENNS